MSSEVVREGVLYLHYYFSTSKPGHRSQSFRLGARVHEHESGSVSLSLRPSVLPDHHADSCRPASELIFQSLTGCRNALR